VLLRRIIRDAREQRVAVPVRLLPEDPVHLVRSLDQQCDDALITLAQLAHVRREPHRRVSVQPLLKSRRLACFGRTTIRAAAQQERAGEEYPLHDDFSAIGGRLFWVLTL